MCNNGDTLTDGERHQVVLVTDRFIHEEASDPRGPVKYQPWIQRGHPWGSLWFSLTDDYAVLTDSCPVTLSEVSLEAAMRSVLDRQPVPVQGNTPPERFLRYLNQTRQANVDFFAADQIIEGTSEPGSGTYLRPRQYAALRRSLTNDVRRMAELTPPAPMRAGQMALEHTMTLTLKFEQEFIESLDPNTNVRGVVMQAILTRAENARNVWLVSVQRLDDAYDVVPPAWAGPTPAQAASS